MMRTRTLSIDSSESTLASLAERIDSAVSEACATIKAEGGRVASIHPFPMSTSHENDGSDWRRCSDRGVLVVIAYAQEADGG